ncbi:MAG TPA: hypothetical protein PLE74_05260 [Candidatus Cloacimonadota bacterium]|nr:hypothetical protein [Candidatus Cloacimonadota bacterium]
MDHGVMGGHVTDKFDVGDRVSRPLWHKIPILLSVKYRPTDSYPFSAYPGMNFWTKLCRPSD